MADLASLADYQLRHGDVASADEAKVTALLGDASSMVREVSRLYIEAVTDEVLEVDGSGTPRIILPEMPVTDVSSVVVDGETLAATDYRWWSWGGLDRCAGGVWPYGPREVTVTYSHGWAPVQDWVIGLVCSIVFEALRDNVTQGEQSLTTGSQTVSYFTARSNLFIADPDAKRLRMLKGPVQ